MPPPRADSQEIAPEDDIETPSAEALTVVELPSQARDSPTSPALPDADAVTAPLVEAVAPTVRPAMLCDMPTESELAAPSVLIVALVPSKPEPDQLTPESLNVTAPKSPASPILDPDPPPVTEKPAEPDTPWALHPPAITKPLTRQLSPMINRPSGVNVGHPLKTLRTPN